MEEVVEAKFDRASDRAQGLNHHITLLWSERCNLTLTREQAEPLLPFPAQQL